MQYAPGGLTPQLDLFLNPPPRRTTPAFFNALAVPINCFSAFAIRGDILAASRLELRVAPASFTYEEIATGTNAHRFEENIISASVAIGAMAPNRTPQIAIRAPAR